MQVDFRENYSQKAYLTYRSQYNYEPIALEEISDSKFYAAGDLGRFHYSFSRCVVGEWLNENSDWLQRMLEVGFFSKFPTREFVNRCNVD